MLTSTIGSIARLICPKFSLAFCTQAQTSLRERLRAIEKQRLSTPKEELDRLKSNPLIRPRLENVISAYERQKMFGLSPSLLHQISFCRSIEVLKAVEKTHFVLNHGQSSSCLLSLNILNSEIQKNTDQNLEFETKLRHPLDFADQPLCAMEAPVDWFKATLDYENHRKTRITDHHFKNLLIACDGYLGSTAQAESAWSYFLGKGSKGHAMKWRIIHHLALKLISDPKKRESFLRKFEQIDSKMITHGLNDGSDFYQRAGNLNSILIPKEDFPSVGYLSKPMGFPAKAMSSELKRLEEMQNDETADKENPLQIRLIASKICNLTTLLFPSRLDQELKENIELIRALVSEYF